MRKSELLKLAYEVKERVKSPSIDNLILDIVLANDLELTEYHDKLIELDSVNIIKFLTDLEEKPIYANYLKLKEGKLSDMEVMKFTSSMITQILIYIENNPELDIKCFKAERLIETLNKYFSNNEINKDEVLNIANSFIEVDE
jgi:hypothetical protein